MSAERKAVGLDVAWQQEPEAAKPARKSVARKPAPEPAQLALLAADPVAYVEGMAAVKRGAARRALNLDVPGELGDWFTRWCRDMDVSQRDVMRALLQGLRADVQRPEAG